MNRLLYALLALSTSAACLAPEAAPDEAVVESALVSPEGQGVDYQGVDYQGVDYQGVDYQGTTFDGASYGGGSLLYGSVTGTELVAWRRIGTGKAMRWEQRFPAQLCLWDAARAIRLSCTSYDLATQPSPLAGSTWPAEFIDENGQPVTLTLRIGTGTGDLQAVRRDPTRAMYRLSGHETYCGTDHRTVCDPVHGCHLNCDLWLYDVYVLEAGHEGRMCRAGELAMALDDTWDSTGQRVPSSDRFTFACTNGTIAKCTRWGYRPFGHARKCSRQSCDTDDPTVPLADYHQACIRAATADYCANGHSFTKNGTLVDIYDFAPHQSGAKGFIPQTKSLAYLQGIPSTAFVGESEFDKHGATSVDYMRYFDAGSIQDPFNGCPGRLPLPVAGPDGLVLQPSTRTSPPPTTPRLWIDSTPMCSHSEHTIGRQLHPGCSGCTREMWQDPDLTHCMAYQGTWDSSCVAASAACTAARMTDHGECDAGPALPIYASACTLRVCLDTPSCCTTSWTASCTAAANARCTGGREQPLWNRGFCGVALPLPPNG